MHYIFIFIFLICFPLGTFAEDFDCKKTSQIPIEGLMKKVSLAYQKIEGLSAKFSQTSSFLGFAEKNESEGEVFFRKPGKMDWQYVKPESQRFVSDGKTLWFYQPELEQVTVGDFKDSFQSDLPVSFLLGIGNIEDSFKLVKVCETEKGILLHLLPKTEDAAVEKFNLLVENDQHRPLGAKMIDAAGNQTSILFENLVYNAGYRDISFNFEIPRGVDVIDQRGY